MNLTQILMLVGIFSCGIFYALHIKLIKGNMGWKWHLLQWIPMLLGMTATIIYSVEWYKLSWTHSIFGNGGIIILLPVMAGAGYVIGLHFIWKEVR